MLRFPYIRYFVTTGFGGTTQKADAERAKTLTPVEMEGAKNNI